MKRKTGNQHVTKHPDGGWQVKGGGNSRATHRTETQSQAFEKARAIAKNKNSEVIIHSSDGKINRKHSYGNDPYPPKG